MQYKIQEIMGLVDALSVECIALGIGQMASSVGDKATLGGDVKKARDLLESKLRELVREPLSESKLDDLCIRADVHGRYAETFERGVRWGARATERAHGITTEGGE